MMLPKSMIFWYFLVRICKVFVASFIGLTLFFASINLVSRLPLGGTLETFSIVFWTMLPLTSFFALPMAAALAVQVVVGAMVSTQEIVLFYYLEKVHYAFYKALFVFSLALGVLYIPLVFEWGPRSYSMGKELLVAIAKKELGQLAPHVLHSPVPGFSFFFKEKVFISPEEPVFKNLFIILKDKKTEHFFTAQEGFFKHDTLLLKSGSVYTINGMRHYQAAFEEADVNMNTILNKDKGRIEGPKQLKLLRFADLVASKDKNNAIKIEIHKRIAQIIWQLIIPFLAFFAVFIFRRNKNSIILASLIAGFLFLTKYIFLALGQIFTTTLFLALSFFYLPPILMVVIFFLLYDKNL